MLAFISQMTFFHMASFTFAFSRTKALANVKVQLPDIVHGRIGLTRNVVYEKALL
jgi:hypothetical protein